MKNIVHKVKVNAPPKIVWELLEDKVYNPVRYMPLSMAAMIMEKFSDGVMSEIQTTLGTLRERVTLDKKRHTIRFELIDHPDFKGERIERVEVQEEKGTCTYAVDVAWKPKSRSGKKLQAKIGPLIQSSVELIAALMEQRAKLSS